MAQLVFGAFIGSDNLRQPQVIVTRPPGRTDVDLTENDLAISRESLGSWTMDDLYLMSFRNTQMDCLDAWNAARIGKQQDSDAARIRKKQDSDADTFPIEDDSLEDILRDLPRGATVIDVGCDGWSTHAMAHSVGRCDLVHIGADLGSQPPDGQPSGTTYIEIPGDGEMFADQVADLAISRHCLEHSSKPLGSFDALLRSVRPGGLVYVECPSDLSCLPRAAADPRGNSFDNFWDDPTHVRPWTPGALYRLALSFGARPIKCGRMLRWDIPCSAILVLVPMSRRAYRYVTLKDVGLGVDAAMRAFWQEL